MEPENLRKIAIDLKELLKDQTEDLLAIVTMSQKIKELGLTIDDACLLSRISREHYDHLTQTYPLIATFIRISQIEYKEKLLQALHDQLSATKDPKIALRLLETNFADEYDSAIKKEKYKNEQSPEAEQNQLHELARLVRESAPATPVNLLAGDPVTSVSESADVDILLDNANLVSHQ
jgi:hypothetical protein